jgi:outer membrane protein TolC
MKKVRGNLSWSVFTLGMVVVHSAALAQLEAMETAVEQTEPAAVRELPLEDAYRLALANEEQIKIAGRELAKAQLLPWRAITQLTPRADVTGTYIRNKEELAFVFPEGFGSRAGTASVIRPEESWQGTFALTQPILQPSFLPSRQLGKDAVQQSWQQYDFTVREVLFGVARAYYDVLRVQAQITVAQETLQLTRDQLQQAQARLRVGEVAETDVLRAEVEVAQAEQNLITIQNDRRLATTVLARTIGVQEPLQVVEPTPPQYPRDGYEQLVAKAYQQRQDLRAREYEVDIARQRKNLVLARYAPQIDTSWRFDRRDTETFAELDNFWTLFLNFRVPLFDGGVREIDLMEQEENLGEARLQVDRLRKDITVEVQQALVAAETLSAMLTTLKKQVALAERNYDLTAKQYRVGEATSLDVNNTLNTLNLVRVRFTNQTYAYQLALLNLERVVGSFGQAYMLQR